jgi:hypothetical protein
MKYFLLFLLSIIAIIKCQQQTNIYYNELSDGNYYFRQKNNKKVSTAFASHIFSVTTKNNYGLCLFNCNHITACLMGVYNVQGNTCSLYSYLVTDNDLVPSTDDYTFFKAGKIL